MIDGNHGFTQTELDNLAKGFAQGRIAGWMLMEALDDDEELFRFVVNRSKNFNSSVDDGEAIDGLI